MTNLKTPKVLRMAVWAVQIVMSVTLIWAAYMKLFKPVETLAAMWPWAGQVPPLLVKLTGAVDLLAGLGLVLPALLNIRPVLTNYAAIGVVLLMLCAMVFHLSRGESLVFNAVFAVLAVFVAWGRQATPVSLCKPN